MQPRGRERSERNGERIGGAYNTKNLTRSSQSSRSFKNFAFFAAKKTSAADTAAIQWGGGGFRVLKIFGGFRFFLDGRTVKLDSEGGVHPGEVFRCRRFGMHDSNLANLKKLSVASKLAPYCRSFFKFNL